ncbi:hypothetical protein Sj15T_09840 [Sphingobium sp. TA15]|uniref:DUF4262 domain-containing protein n=1 Tax=Sphingobium indicum (strain DSM 16413 / CCM 7287 / MTCC 6362 / UT26 / NBRC 101211 / UT26S) TaxID=452662 RepID=D4Z249_SPHIU|nr:DUF4262 domain-containing protein [Sphingobium indicum]BAI96681.1 hypothetical protein SJA_C1-18470 [Sphingobium indicum UT26S]BDD65963.1 hypothetical protein Sj15T_09840 [Sphingobium sp. TA15]
MPTSRDPMSIVQDNIDRTGQHLFAIFGSDDEPAFVYTVGNAVRGLPELLLIGNFRATVAGGILNDLGTIMRKQERALSGDIGLGGRYPVRIRRASEGAKFKWTIQAGQYLGHDHYDVLQVLLCDYDGHYPGERGCNPDFGVPLA